MYLREINNHLCLDSIYWLSNSDSRVDGARNSWANLITVLQRFSFFVFGFFPRPIIHLPDFQIRTLLAAHFVPPTIEVVGEGAGADSTEVVKFGEVFDRNSEAHNVLRASVLGLRTRDWRKESMRLSMLIESSQEKARVTSATVAA